MGGGRELLVRPCHEGDGVQIAIVSTRGNIIEAVTFDASNVGAVTGAVEAAAELAGRDLMAALAKREQEASERYKAALKRNPWLNGSKKVDPAETYIARPR